MRPLELGGLYHIWQAMHDRTGNPNATNYRHYGGRGISVCHEWQMFEPFQKWALSNGYEDRPDAPRRDHLTIDRIDPDGNYEPSNCRWATQLVQVHNRRPKRSKGANSMREFKETAAQGDVYFRRVDSIPAGLTEVAPNSRGEIVVTHSETSHNHVMVLDRAETPAVQMFNGDNPLVSWLQVNRPTALEHQREHHTHESILFQPGMYEVRRQVEQTPEGWRQVQD